MIPLETYLEVEDHKKAPKVLVVEDEILVAKDIAQGLEEMGYEVVGRASNGEEGIKRALARQPDVVLMDIRLPGSMDGIQAAEAIQTQSSLPVVFLTAFSDEETLERVKNAAPFGYLVKPFNKTSLRATIEVALARNQMQKREKEKGHYLAHKLDTAIAKLRFSEERYQTLIQNANESIWILDPQGMILEANRAAAEIAGRPQEGIAGLHFTQLLGAEEAKRRVLDFEEFLRKGTTQLEGIEVLRPDGEKRIMDLSAALVRVGVESLVMTLGTDVTFRRRLEAEKLKTQRLEILGQMAAAIAHDFNNILSVINLHAGLLEEEAGEKETFIKEGLEIILSSSRQAKSLTEQLLAFGKPKKSKIEEKNINEMIPGIAIMIRCLVGKGIELSTSLDPQLGLARLEEGHLSQILMNLAVNARDAMPSNGRLTIETANEAMGTAEPDGLPEGNYVRVSVEDNGCGMDSPTLSRIFEPYFTTKEEGKGTGLGLSTVFDLVRRNQGQIRVESQPGKGTRFRIYFPRV